MRDYIAVYSQELAVLGDSLNVGEILAGLVRLPLPRLADCCVLDVTTDGHSVQRLAAHAEPAMAGAVKRLLPFAPNLTQLGSLLDNLRAHKAEVRCGVRAIMASEVLRGEEHRSAVQALKPRSGIQVSFQCADTIAGALSLWYTRPGRSYREEDCNIAVRLAEAAGAALGNAQSYGRQGRAAEGLQRHLVPHSLPLVAGLDLAACYCPADGEARVGGDFYDVFPTRGPAWALMIGDVMGHGAEVASAATIARHVMRAMATRISTPSRVLAGLNATLMGDAENELLCSAEYVRLEWNEEGARVMVASGGHPLPILLRAGTAYAIGLTGLLLGMQDDYTAPDFVLQLRPGDALVLYTDGVTEARCGREMLGEDRLLEILRSCAGRSAREIVECIQREVIRFRNDFRKDDLAVLVMRLAEQI